MRKTDKPNYTGGATEAGTKCSGRAEELTINLLTGLREDFKEIMIFGLGSEG